MAGPIKESARCWVIRQGRNLSVIESEAAPDLAVPNGTKTKVVELGPVTRGQADAWVDLKVKIAQAIRA